MSVTWVLHQIMPGTHTQGRSRFGWLASDVRLLVFAISTSAWVYQENLDTYSTRTHTHTEYSLYSTCFHRCTQIHSPCECDSDTEREYTVQRERQRIVCIDCVCAQPTLSQWRMWQQHQRGKKSLQPSAVCCALSWRGVGRVCVCDSVCMLSQYRGRKALSHFHSLVSTDSLSGPYNQSIWVWQLCTSVCAWLSHA